MAGVNMGRTRWRKVVAGGVAAGPRRSSDTHVPVESGGDPRRMAVADEVASRRRKGLLWGIVAVACLGGSLVVLLVSPQAASSAGFGRAVSLVIVAAAVVLTVTGAGVVLASAQTSWGMRWGVALPLAIAAGGVAVLALATLVTPRQVADAVIAVLLAGAVVGMNVVAAQVARRVVPGHDRR